MRRVEEEGNSFGLLRTFCVDQGRKVGSSCTSIDEVVSIARVFKGEERDFFLDSFAQEILSSRKYGFDVGYSDRAREVLIRMIKSSIAIIEERQAVAQPKLLGL